MQEEKQRRKGPWSSEEDECLRTYVALLGERRWDSIAKATGLERSGKSCRLRWLNYLRPNLKHSPISPEEEKMILHLHRNWGNKWAKIARKLPGRTDNEIKNYWRTHLRKNTSTTTAMQLQPLRGGDEELEEDEEREVLHAGYSNSTKAALSISTSNNSTNGISGPERILVKRGSNSSGNLISYRGVVDNYGDQSCNIRFNPADHHVSTSCAVATSPYENHYLHWTSLLLPCGSDHQLQVLDAFDLQNTTFGYPNDAEGSSLLTQQGYCFDNSTLWS